MNKKIILLTTILALSLMLTPIVMAKPSSDKNNSKFEYFLWHSTNPREPEGEPAVGGSIPIDVKINPPESVPPKVTHTYAEWTLDPSGENTIQVGAESEPIPISGYEGFLYVQMNQLTPTSIALNYRVYERIEWNGNYVEIMANERASYDLSSGTFYASGTFSGHGEVEEQKVQVMGIREGYFEVDLSTGNLIFVLDNVGTLQYLGN